VFMGRESRHADGYTGGGYATIKSVREGFQNTILVQMGRSLSSD
jgi:hypothetical protein